MRLEDMSVRLRGRTPWEAMDLGQALVRRHARQVWGVWLAMSLPPWLLLNALAWLLGLPWLAWLLMWWLKPLFDRGVLFVISRATFGAVPGVRETLGNRVLWQAGDLFAALTWRRLHPARSLVLPATMLEGLSGERRRKRQALLQQSISSQAYGLTLVCMHLELVVFASIWVLGLMFVPTEFLSQSAAAVWQTFFQDPPVWALIVANGVIWLATSLVEPFYVGAGFGMYLNRRVQLEAWDIELAFRRLAARVQALSPALLLILALAAVAPAHAAAPKQDDAPKSVRTLVGDQWRAPDAGFEASAASALKDPLLGGSQTRWRWEPKVPNTEKKVSQKPSTGLLVVGKVLAFLAEYGLWLLAGVLLALLLWRFPRWWRDYRADAGPRPVARQAPTWAPLAGPSLPADLDAVAADLWRQGQAREALSLLFRGGVAWVERQLGAPLPPGSTEAECLRRARRLEPRESVLVLGDVVLAWQAMAYAHRVPADEDFQALLQRWSSHLGDRP